MRTDQISYSIDTCVPVTPNAHKYNMKLVFCRRAEVELDLTIIDSIKNAHDENILRVYAEQNYINVDTGDTSHIHLTKLM